MQNDGFYQFQPVFTHFHNVCRVRQNLYVFSLYHNPDQDDWIFDCLLAPTAAMQAEDIRAAFLFVGDLNGSHQEWLGSTTTRTVMELQPLKTTLSSCDQLVVGLTHARGGTLDQRRYRYRTVRNRKVKKFCTQLFELKVYSENTDYKQLIPENFVVVH